MLKRIIEIYILCLYVRGLYLNMLIIFSHRQKYSLKGEKGGIKSTVRRRFVFVTSPVDIFRAALSRV